MRYTEKKFTAVSVHHKVHQETSEYKQTTSEIHNIKHEITRNTPVGTRWDLASEIRKEGKKREEKRGTKLKQAHKHHKKRCHALIREVKV